MSCCGHQRASYTIILTGSAGQELRYGPTSDRLPHRVVLWGEELQADGQIDNYRVDFEYANARELWGYLHVTPTQVLTFPV